jgi:N-acetylglucosaminyltransferase
MTISILIPCYNEEQSIKQCIQGCLSQTRRPDQIIVVDDGSTDRTPEILAEFGHAITVIRVPHNTGNKSKAQEYGLQFVRDEVFVTTDADTFLDQHFVAEVERSFQNQEVSAMAGYIRSIKYNWLTACRELDYLVNQNIYKLAQSYIGSIFVIAGCAAAFRTAVFKQHVSFEHDTVTEDLDFTYKFHKKGLQIQYNNKAIVYTQDPADLHSYINQMRRWYGGGWQNLLKHFGVLKTHPGHRIVLTVSYIEGLVFAALLYALPFLNLQVFGYLLLTHFIFSIVYAMAGALKSQRWDLLWYAPCYTLMLFVNAWVFLERFFVEIIQRQRHLTWFKPARRSFSPHA